MNYFKRLASIALLITIAAPAAWSQHWDLYYDYAGDFHDGLAKVELNDKYGYLNNLGAEVVPCIYDEAHDFSHGLAKVKRKGKYGFVNVNGEEVIPCKYDEIKDFDSDFMAQATCNGHKGFIKRSGGEVIECKYDEIGKFDDRLLAPARLNGKWGLVHKINSDKGCDCVYDEILPFNEGHYKVRRNGKWGFLDANGHVVAQCNYDTATDFNNGWSMVSQNGKYGFLNSDGNLAIACQYDNGTKSFVNGLATVVRNGLYGIISTDGKEVVPCEYKDAEPLSIGIIKIVDQSGKCGLSNVMGKKVMQCKYDNITYLGENLIKVAEGSKCGIYDTYGKKIVSNKYDEIRKFGDNLAPASENGRFFYIDKQGKKALSTTYDDALPFNNGVAMVKNNGYYSLINSRGETITNYPYDEINEFKNGTARVKRNGMIGHINSLGQEVIPCRYDRIDDFDSNTMLAKVTANGKMGYINSDGNEVIPCQYDRIEKGDVEGQTKVLNNGKWGIIGDSGRELVPCQYDETDYFSDDMALVKLGNKWGYVGRNGNSSISCQYDDALPFNDGVAAVKKDGMYGYINTRNATVIPFQFTKAGSFSNGLANVNGNSYIKSNGDVIIVYQSTVDITPEFASAVQRYDLVGRFYEGRAAVCKNKKWGFINTLGEEKIPCQYDLVNRFCQKLAAVKLNDSWGFIDPNGSTIIPITMNVSDVGLFSEGLAFVASNMDQPMSYYFINNKGEKVFGDNNLDRNMIVADNALIIEKIPIFRDGECYIPVYNGRSQYAVYNTSGQVVKNTDITETITKNNGYFVFEDESTHLRGVKDTDGNIILPAKYFNISTDANGNAALSSGVFNVQLLEIDPSNPDGGVLRYAFADLKGHDTFAQYIIDRVNNSYQHAASRQTVVKVAEVNEAENTGEESYEESDEKKGYLIPHQQSMPTQEMSVGTLVTYRASSEFKINNYIGNDQKSYYTHRYKIGELICASNDPGYKLTTYDGEYYKYQGEWDGNSLEFLVPKNMVKREEFKFDEMLTEELQYGPLVFTSKEGNMKATFVKINQNGHQFLDKNNNPVANNNTYFMSVCEDGLMVFGATLGVQDNHLMLYNHNEAFGGNNRQSERWREYGGIIAQEYMSVSGTNPFDSRGNMTSDLKKTSKNKACSIAYMRKDRKLYVNGEWLFLK